MEANSNCAVSLKLDQIYFDRSLKLTNVMLRRSRHSALDVSSFRTAIHPRDTRTRPHGSLPVTNGKGLPDPRANLVGQALAADHEIATRFVIQEGFAPTRADAVLSRFGSKSLSKLVVISSEGATNLLRAMTQHGVRLIFSVSRISNWIWRAAATPSFHGTL